MKKLDITQGISQKEIMSDISKVVALIFQFEREANVLIGELNNIDPVSPDKYDDSELRKSIADVESRIPEKYDDSKIMSALSRLESVDNEPYDDEGIKLSISSLEKKFKSLRREQGQILDGINQKINRMEGNKDG